VSATLKRFTADEMRAGAGLDFNSHIALPFGYTKNNEISFIAFDSAGPQTFTMAVEKFDSKFTRKLDKPVEEVARSFLKASQSAYLPGDGVLKLILEIYIMGITSTDALADKPLKDIVAAYNELAVAAGKNPVKEFKSKLVGLNRLQAMIDEAAAGTPKQQANKEKAKVAAATEEAKKPEAKAAAKKEAKAEAKPKGKKEAKPKGEAKPRGKGIGAFCMDLILNGDSNDEVLTKVKKQFPDAATSMSSIAWYRNKLKSEGSLSA
jgi:hypothetical protein